MLTRAIKQISLFSLKITPPPEAVDPNNTGIVGTIYDVAVDVGLVLAVFFIVYGGYQFTMSKGDSNAVKKAQDTITYAIIGLVIVIIAKVISNFVFGIFFKNDVQSVPVSPYEPT